MIRALLFLIFITSISFTNELKLSTPSNKGVIGKEHKLFFFSDHLSTVKYDNSKFKEGKLLEISDGLFIVSVREKSIDIDGKNYSGTELSILSFKEGEVTLPDLNFTILNDDGDNSSVSSVTFSNYKLSFSSSLKDKKYAPLLGKIIKPITRRNIYYLGAIVLLLVLLYSFFKKIRSYSKQIAQIPRSDKITPKDIIKEISNLKDSDLPIKENYHLLSDSLKKWIFLSLDINATTKSTSDIFKLMMGAENKTSADKLSKKLKELDFPKFSNKDFTKNEFHSDIDYIVGILNEF